MRVWVDAGGGRHYVADEESVISGRVHLAGGRVRPASRGLAVLARGEDRRAGGAADERPDDRGRSCTPRRMLIMVPQSRARR